MSKAARKPYQRVLTFISKQIAYNTIGIGTAATVQVGTIPAGALGVDVKVRVREAFNATTTNVINVGTSADGDAYVATGDVDETALGTTISERIADAVFAADTPVFVTYTQTGTAASAGAADIVITYIPTVED